MRPFLTLLLLAMPGACQSSDGDAVVTEQRQTLAVETASARPDAPAEPATVAEPRATASPITLPEMSRGTSRIPAALQGQWTVVRQAVSGSGVQAYGTDEAELIGRSMTVTATGVRWNGDAAPLAGACQDAFFDGRGDAPAALTDPLRTLSVKPVGALSFLCMGEGSDWGVEQELFEPVLLADGRLALGWFDNLVLVLKRG